MGLYPQTAGLLVLPTALAPRIDLQGSGARVRCIDIAMHHTCFAVDHFTRQPLPLAGYRRIPRRPPPCSAHRLYSLDGFRKSTPPQNRQLFVYHYELEQQVDIFGGELTFQNRLINTL